MVLCGCPFEGVLTIDEADDVDTDTAMPVGAPDFIDAFLSKYRAKVADLVGHIVLLAALQCKVLICCCAFVARRKPRISHDCFLPTKCERWRSSSITL